MATAGRVLMIPAGDWKSGSNYELLDVVVHLGSSYVAKNDINNSTKAPPSDAANWQLLAQGYDVTNIVTKNMVVNNGLTTEEGYVLDARYGKTLIEKDTNLQEQLTTLNGEMSAVKSGFEKWKLVTRYIEIDPGVNYWFSTEALVPAGDAAKYRPVIVSVMESSPEYYITSAVFSAYGTLGIKLNKANANASKLSMTVSILYLAN